MKIQLVKYVTLVLCLQLVTGGTQTHIYRRCNGENQLLLVMNGGELSGGESMTTSEIERSIFTGNSAKYEGKVYVRI